MTPLQHPFGFALPKQSNLRTSATRVWSEQPTNKLLILAKPDEEAAARIARIAQELAAYFGFSGKLVRPHLLHFTIHVLGLFPSVPLPFVDAIGACGYAVRMRPFTVSLSKVMNFRHKSGIPLIVLCGDDGVFGMRILHDMLDVALAQRFPSRSLPFEPHMTLSYKAMEIPETRIEPINFTIREFALVNSIIGQGRHDVRHRWTLGD